MKFTVAALALATGLLAGQAVAQSSTYTVTSTGPYATITPVSNCTTGPTYPCASFTAAMGVSGSFTVSAPLAANLSNTEIGGQISAYEFSSGLHTTSNTDPNSRLNSLRVTTDASGRITTINLMQAAQWLGAGSASNRFNFVAITATSASSLYNSGCQTQGTGNSGVADTCLNSVVADTSRSMAQSSPVALTLVAPAAVPTMTEWAMILFGALLAGASALMIHRRRIHA